MNALPSSSSDTFKNILYLEPIGGISGDMLVGGLLDLGVPFDLIASQLKALNLVEVQITQEKQQRHHLQGTRFIVKTSGSPNDHTHRAFRDIQILIETSSLSSSVRNIALQIFEHLAVVEGEIHGVSMEDVEFHEVGAWDSIADIVSIALGLDYLKINAIYVTPVPLGSGSVQTAHGSMPIPAPATLKLLKGFPVVHHHGLNFERTTPTGAAVIAALAQPVPDHFEFIPDAAGIGIGNHDIAELPNILRVPQEPNPSPLRKWR
jgi:pyridinium-3,5-bisthiocarboxylic acid mononucleotide nickel chelatase